MSWDETGGTGVGTGVGSPEAVRGKLAGDGGDKGPRDEEPQRRPSCLRAAFALFVALVIPLIALWLILQLASRMP